MRCSKLKVIIDRFEGDIAVVELEDGKVVNMAKTLLPQTAKEGSVIKIEIDEDETQKRKNEVQDLFDSLFQE